MRRFLFILPLLLFSCRTPQTVMQRDSVERVVYRDRMTERVDTVFQTKYRDRFIFGDTVYIRDSVMLYKVKIWHDTIHTGDTIRQVITETRTEYVTRQNKWQRFIGSLGYLLIGAIAGFLIYIIIKVIV